MVNKLKSSSFVVTFMAKYQSFVTCGVSLYIQWTKRWYHGCNGSRNKSLKYARYTHMPSESVIFLMHRPLIYNLLWWISTVILSSNLKKHLICKSTDRCLDPLPKEYTWNYPFFYILHSTYWTFFSNLHNDNNEMVWHIIKWLGSIEIRPI